MKLDVAARDWSGETLSAYCADHVAGLARAAKDPIAHDILVERQAERFSSASARSNNPRDCCSTVSYRARPQARDKTKRCPCQL